MPGYKKILLEGDAATLTSTVTPANVDFTVATIGTSTEAARADHKHSAVAGSPVALDGLSADGTSTAFVRADHKHALGPLATFLDFNFNEARRFSLQETSDYLTTPGGTKRGTMVFYTVDNHPYIYVF